MEIVSNNKTQLKTTVTGNEMFKKEVDETMAGNNPGLLLRGIKGDQLKRGMFLTMSGIVKAHTKNVGLKLYSI